MKIPLYLRLLFTDGASTGIVAACTAMAVAQVALGSAPLAFGAVQAAVLLAVLAAAIRERRRLRDLRRAITGFVRAVKALTPDRVYLDREAHVVLTRPAGRGLRLYRSPEDDVAQWTRDIEEPGGTAAVTVDVFEAPFMRWAVMAGNTGGMFRLAADDEPEELGGRPSRRAQARGRWMGLRTGTAFATAAELREVCAQLARSERLDPEAPD